MAQVKERVSSTRTARKQSNIVVKSVDNSADDLDNLIGTDDYSLRVLKKIINMLKKNDITKISQLRKMYNVYGETYTIDKLCELRLIGQKMAEEILTRAICYTYPKGYIPNSGTVNELPSWFTEGADTVERDNSQIKMLTGISMEDLERLCEEDTNNAEDDSDPIREDELNTLFLNMIFDLFEDDSFISPERVKKEDRADFGESLPDIIEHDFEQVNLLYDNNKIMISKDFCYNLFEEKLGNVKTLLKLNTGEKWFYIIDHCEGIYRNRKNGINYSWSKLYNIFGYKTKTNYIEINISTAEAVLNRKLNVLNSNEIESIANSITGKKKTVSYSEMEKILTENDTVETSYYLIPLSCTKDLDGTYTFNFKVIDIEDRFNFNTFKSSNGTYVFDRSNKEDGDLLLPKGFDDNQYDEIHKIIIEFLSK